MGPRVTTPSQLWRIIFGGLVGDLVMGVLYAALVYLAQAAPHPGGPGTVWLIAIPSLALIPMIGGIVAAYLWRRLEMSVGQTILHTLWMPLIAVAGGAIIFREGIVCLLMVLPLLCASIIAGAVTGRVWFKINRSNLNLCIFPLVLVITLGELQTRNYQPEVVVDKILIHAPPDKVWPHVLAFPPITEAPNYWLFWIGLPYPVATTNSGNFVGAGRQCIFSSGVVLKEFVSTFDAPNRLTFDIAEQPTHPEAYGHITLHRGQFDLIDNHDGTTTLIGSSWYTLHVRPLFYFDWWVRDMTRAVHLRVMRHVRELSETPA